MNHPTIRDLSAAAALASTLALGWLAACATPPTVATYQGGEVTTDDYESWLRFLEMESDTDEDRERRLTDLVSRRVLAADAERAGRHEELGVRMALLDAEALRLQRALSEQKKNAVQVTDDEVEAGFDALGGPVIWPERVRLQNLFKRLPEGASPADAEALRARMEALRQDLADGADFALLASAESESQTRFRGGNMGFVKPGQLDPSVEATAFALGEGELSPVIETPQGFTILRCRERRASEVQDPETVRARVRAGLLRDKKRTLEKDLASAWLEGVEIDLQALQLTSTPGDAVVLRVADGPSLTVAEITALLRGRGLRRPLSELSPNGLRGRAEQIAGSLRAAQLAREQGLDADDEMAGRIRWDRLGILASAEISARVQERFPPVTDAEARAHFASQRRRYRHPASFHLASVVWRTELGTLAATHAEARKVAADLAAGRVSFAAAAAAHSDLPSAQSGGVLGWMDKKRMASLGPSVSQVVLELEPGDISELIEQQEDLRGTTTLWIVQLIDRRPERPMTFEEAARRAKNEVGNRRARELQAQILDELAAELDLSIVATPAS